MRRLIVATKNRNKLKEIMKILEKFSLDVVSTDDAGIDEDIEEYGSTFEENALIKARRVAKLTGEIALADDSGLEVDYLDGAPGVLSSRFLGKEASDEDKNNRILELMEGVPLEKRKARFICAIAVVFPEGGEFTVRGVCEGYISFKQEGSNGFGYDPIFYLPAYKMTVAQLAPHVKNLISHRAKALKLMVDKLRDYICTNT